MHVVNGNFASRRYRVVFFAVHRDLCLFPLVADLSRAQPEPLLAGGDDAELRQRDELLEERERVRVHAEHMVEESETLRRARMATHKRARGAR